MLAASAVMQALGLSTALGAFIAGVMLAESPYRHELEADIDPFRSILLGLFFLAWLKLRPAAPPPPDLVPEDKEGPAGTGPAGTGPAGPGPAGPGPAGPGAAGDGPSGKA